jgi:uncharacterized protein YhdP
VQEVPAVAEVKETAAGLLSSLADRWQHTRSVAARAEELAAAVPVCDRGLLVVAAWWHDLGYSPALRVTGLHQLDGARYLAASVARTLTLGPSFTDDYRRYGPLQERRHESDQPLLSGTAGHRGDRTSAQRVAAVCRS